MLFIGRGKFKLLAQGNASVKSRMDSTSHVYREVPACDDGRRSDIVTRPLKDGFSIKGLDSGVPRDVSSSVEIPSLSVLKVRLAGEN